MRIATLIGLIVPAASAVAQSAVVAGQVILRQERQPLGYATVAIFPQGRQLLTSDAGRFQITVPAGEVRLRFKRIGFTPVDTSFQVVAADTVRLRIEMTRLVIQLPEMLVSGKCTNETPREPVPGFLAELMDQVSLNSQAMALLVAQKPFQVRTEHTNGYLDRNDVFSPTRVDTILRTNPLPDSPYKPRQVLFRIMTGPYAGAWGIRHLELTDLADTAFTNNHCFSYAGRAKIGSDSVVQVTFTPVPWLDREIDLSGTFYLKADGYQLVGSFTRLNRRTPAMERDGLEEYFVEARFREIVPGVPITDTWELTNRFRNNRPRFIQRGRVISIDWK
jgi:hypothetical protein